MGILSWLALIFLTLFGYSAGAVIGGRTRRGRQAGEPSPSMADTLAVVVLWIGAVVSRVNLMKRWTAVGFWFVVALGTAFIMNLVQRRAEEGKSITQ